MIAIEVWFARIGLLVVLGALLGVAWRVIDPPASAAIAVRRRFLGGIPWGTFATVLLVALVYLLVQDGLARWTEPLVIPYRAWSYRYPLGILASGLAHASPGHLVGNLTATLVVAPIAEFAWGHFPAGRGRSPFDRWRDRPVVRIAAVPTAAVVCAVLTGAFAWGPVIGFSGVVFAFAGVAIVTRPVATVVAIVLGDGVGLLYRALVEPVATASAGVSYTTPWWANVAVQGHLLGLGIGVTAGVALAIGRDRRPAARWVWIAALGFALDQTLWALYWAIGDGYRLYRAIGTVAIVALAILVTAAATGRGAIFDDPIGRWVDGTPLGRLEWGLPTRGTALTILVGVLVVTAVGAVAFNLQTVDSPASETAVEIEDYRVSYDIDRQGRQVSVLDEFVPRTLAWNFSASGVVVTSEQRSIWAVAVPADRLRQSNNATVALGGPTWRRDVRVDRRGWAVPDNRSAIAVDITPEDGQRHRVYTDGATTPNLTIEGATVTIAPADGQFELRVSEDGRTVDRAPVPPTNGTATVGPLEVRRIEDSLYASGATTRVRIAERIGSDPETDGYSVTLESDRSSGGDRPARAHDQSIR